MSSIIMTRCKSSGLCGTI